MTTSYPHSLQTSQKSGLDARPVLFLLGLCLAMTFDSAAFAQADAAAKKRIWWTYPMPPKVRATDPLALNPAFQVPEVPGNYTWSLVAAPGQKDPTDVPVYGEGGRGERVVIGRMAVGTAVKLETVRVWGKVHHYGVPFSQGGTETTTAWISGMNIKPTGFASTAK